MRIDESYNLYIVVVFEVRSNNFRLLPPENWGSSTKDSVNESAATVAMEPTYQVFTCDACGVTVTRVEYATAATSTTETHLVDCRHGKFHISCGKEDLLVSGQRQKVKQQTKLLQQEDQNMRAFQ